MQSKTSFFNKTLYRKNLSRYWPLWGMASFLAALFPLAMLVQLLRMDTHFSMEPLEATQAYYSAVAYVLPWLTLIYAVLCAVVTWGYLYNARSVGTMHTLPIRRQGLFVTGLLSGLTMALAPYVVLGALMGVISLCFGFFEPVGFGVTVLAVLGETLFYFGSATCVAFITGNAFAMPALYFIFHSLAAGLDLLVSAFSAGFYFGVNGEYTGVVEWLSPTVYLINNVRVDCQYMDVQVAPDITRAVLQSVSLEKGWLIAAYAAVGAVLLVIAWLLYSRRRSESAGDVVAVGWMKPVFRCGVTLISAMLFGLALYAIFWGSYQSGSYYETIPLAVSMLVAGAIGYYAASMLLAKSLRVFRGSWKGLVLTAVFVAAVIGVFRFDLFGVERRVPQLGEIKELYLYTANNSYTLYPDKDADTIENIRALHAAIIADKDYVEATNRRRYADDWQGYDAEGLSRGDQVRLTYTLNSGRTVSRSYWLYLSRGRLEQPGTYDNLLDTLVNSEDMKQRRLRLDKAGLTPEYVDIYADCSGTSETFGSRQAKELLEAVSADAAEGTWGNYDWFENDEAGQYALDVSVQFRNPETGYYEGHISINVTPAMTHTVEYLLGQNMVKATDLVPRGLLHPDWYDEDYEKYGAAYEEAYADDAASVGIIGGADGPTAIYVG